MSSQSPKRLLFSHFATLARTLGNAHRLEILELLAQAEQPVEVLTERTGLTFANVSQHLQQLRKAGLVISRRAGKNIYYRLHDGPILEALSALGALAEHNLAAVGDVIKTYYTRLDDMDAVSSAELLGRLEDGTAVLLDVRPEDEFEAGHIRSAVNIRMDRLKARLAELPAGTEIIAYCRGPYCILSFQAVKLLRAKGFRARRLSAGFPEWKAAGLPTRRSQGASAPVV
jgi:ArsR family transcriptional regulator